MIGFLSEMLTVAVDWRWWLLFGWLPLAVIGAPMLGVWLYERRKERERRQQEALAASWARLHGGDPEYGGNLRGRAA